MKLGVWISRLSQCRHLESLLQAAALAGHRICLYLDQSLAGGPKDRQTPRLAGVPDRIVTLVERIVLSTPRDPDPEGFRPDLFVAAYAPGLRPRRMGCPTAFVQGGFSDLMDWADPPDWDRLFVWTPAWRAWWSQWRGAPAPPGMIPVGMPQADLQRPPVTRRRRVILLPLSLALMPPLWAAWWRGPWGMERAWLRALRAFCDRAEARLVVKLRDKTPITAAGRAVADAVVQDGPDPDVLWLLSGETVLVHFCSSGTAEAAAVGVPARCLVPDASVWRPYRDRGRRVAAFSPWGADSFYHWPPVASAESVRAAIHTLDAARTWADWVPDLRGSPGALAHYRERFIGLPPYRAGDRMLRALTELLHTVSR